MHGDLELRLGNVNRLCVFVCLEMEHNPISTDTAHIREHIFVVIAATDITVVWIRIPVGVYRRL